VNIQKLVSSLRKALKTLQHRKYSLASRIKSAKANEDRKLAELEANEKTKRSFNDIESALILQSTVDEQGIPRMESTAEGESLMDSQESSERNLRQKLIRNQITHPRKGMKNTKNGV